MKKLLLIGGVVVVIFVLIVVLSNKSDETKLKDNPYNTERLDQSSINLIGNENYENIILPDELSKKIEAGESVTAYFFSPKCSYCLEMTPIMMPVAKDMGVTVHQYNLLEFESEAAPYGIQSTPTLVQYKDGQEVGRVVGAQPEENIRAFFNEYESD